MVDLTNYPMLNKRQNTPFFADLTNEDRDECQWLTDESGRVEHDCFSQGPQTLVQLEHEAPSWVEGQPS